MYPIIKVADDAATTLEQLGTKEKFWFVGDQGNTLFKRNRQRCGDDWAEKICCEVCGKLGIPHAHYELAIWKGNRGVVTPSVVPEHGRLVLGNELLPYFYPEYPGTQRFKVRQHTIGRVATIIGGEYMSAGRKRAVREPIGAMRLSEINSSLDYFIGYLMLDALVANQDRHHENWALLVSPEPAIHLAPTFDHASSLGTTETDSNRADRLTTKDRNRAMSFYVTRARSPFYRSPKDRKELTTIDAFVEAGKRRRLAANAWLDRLERLQHQDFEEVVDEVPEHLMNSNAKAFAKQIMTLNQERLLEIREALR